MNQNRLRQHSKAGRLKKTLMGYSVLQLISSAGYFGAEKVLHELALELRDMGVSLTVGVFDNFHNSNLELFERVKSDGLEAVVFECSGRFDSRTVRQIASYIDRHTIDILHSHGYKSNIYAKLATLKKNKPLLSTCHNWIEAGFKINSYSALDKYVLRLFDAVVPVSEEVKNKLLQSGIKEHKITVIENGINMHKLQVNEAPTALRKEFGFSETDAIVGTVGRLSPEKGHQFLLQAAKMILEENSCKFLIVGNGPLNDQLKAQARSMRIETKVVFTGNRQDIPQMLALMDIFVMPSLTEGLPMALLEAMAQKKALVVTDVGSMPRILQNGLLGRIVPICNPSALAEAIRFYLKEKDQARLQGEMAFQAVSQRYTSYKMAKEYLKIYTTLITEKHNE